MAQSMQLFKRLAPERMSTAKLKVPYHDGAIAFYGEAGIEEAQ